MDDFMKQYESLRSLAPQIRQQINIKKTTNRDSISYNKVSWSKDKNAQLSWKLSTNLILSQSNVRARTLLNSFESDLKQLRNELQRLTNAKR